MTDHTITAQAAEQEIEAIMEQAQVFASAWSFISGPFDSGSGLETAEREKANLRALLSKLRAPVADEEIRPIAPDDETIAEAWVTASDSDGIECDGPSFERGYRLGEISERDRAALASAPVAGEAQRRGNFLPEHVTQQMIWNVQAVSLDQCHGLKLSTQQARNIMAFLMNEHGPDAVPQASEAVRDAEAWLIEWKPGDGNTWVEADANEVRARDKAQRVDGTVTPMVRAAQPAQQGAGR